MNMKSDIKLDELLARIDRLEQEVIKLHKPILTVSTVTTSDSPTETKEESVRSQARTSLIHQIQTRYPGLVVNVASRTDGGGLLVTTRETGKSYRMKFVHSKSHRSDRLFAWFSIKNADLYQNDFDFYAFCITYLEEPHAFLFSKEQMFDVLKAKKAIRPEAGTTLRSQNDLEHFYIEDAFGNYYETREIDKNLDESRKPIADGINVDKYHNNFKIFERMIGSEVANPSTTFVTMDSKVIRMKILKILKEHSLVRLNKKDFFYSGDWMQYIETLDEKLDYEMAPSILRDAGSAVFHLYADANYPIGSIYSLQEIVKSKLPIDLPLVFGLTISDQQPLMTQLFLIGKKKTKQESETE